LPFSLSLLFPFAEDRQKIRQSKEEDVGGENHQERPEEPFLEGLHILRNDRQGILHEAAEGGGEGLAADNDIPAHHEDADQNEDGGENCSAHCQPRPEEEDKGDEVAEAVLEDKDFDEVLFVDAVAEDIPIIYSSLRT